ncbi:hypothetical protein GIW70_13210 [Pseudomonas syringae]|nr:hypothetical protein [Pseudomonas syringae]MCF5069143.1 hypothetical protein [Pseudomonas syringae]
MLNIEAFRTQAHPLLIELDAATTRVMMLVVASDVSGNVWEEATTRQRVAYEAWATHLNGIATDPMPELDGRPTDKFVPPSD